ncbi:unnamed protein product [Thlaspi arvense]|uniref:Uncharacterized protein n=1 Tax=Thlaspi arvense TaxID=13288 RepID=A0AAU9R8Z0_THLAR|nr:unnamed protein product [Thlaspi arvense]
MDIHDDAKTETSSGSSVSFLPLKKRKRTLDDAPDNALVATATKKFAFSGNANYKGVVQQQNDRWGAQIYTEKKRIWLGTFNSAAEAAMAYDSANNIVGPKQNGGDEQSNKRVPWTLIFRKELTHSDVGKLNRLVIPKKHAVKYFPLLSDDQNEREEGEIVGDEKPVELVFHDREMRQWKFRYCYWRSSQSFVFTSGWKDFVKEKKLKKKDVVVFYKCNDKTLEGESNESFMIDVKFFSDNDSSVVTDEEVNGTVLHISPYKEERKTKNLYSTKLEDEETKSEEKKGGFMLFGVRIQ